MATPVLDPKMFGRFLRERREAVGCDQTSAAARAHISARRLSDFERGLVVNAPAPDVERGLERALGLKRGTLRQVALTGEAA